MIIIHVFFLEKLEPCIDSPNLYFISVCLLSYNHLRGVMVSMLASSVADRCFEPQSGQAKDYKMGMCCISAKHAVLRRQSKDWLDRNHDNMSVWKEVSIR